MNDGYWFALTITFPDSVALAKWRSTALRSSLDGLAKVDVEDTVPFFGDAVSEDADGAAFLAWATENGLTVEEGGARLVVSGELDDFDGYQRLQPAVIAAAATAVTLGGSARAGFFADYGQEDGPVNETLIAEKSGMKQSRTHGWEDSDESARAALAKSFGVDLETFLSERGGA